VSLIPAVGQGKWDTGPALYLWEGAFHIAVEHTVGSMGMVSDKYCCCWIDTLIAARGNTDGTEWT